MRLRSLPWIATAVLCALGAPAIASDWVDIKNPLGRKPIRSGAV